MAHYAYVNDENIVTQVVVGKNEDEAPGNWEAYYGAIRTSYNTRGGVHYDAETGEPSADQSKALRYNYAGVGFTYDPDFGADGAFIPPKPFPSWTLNADTALWDAPVPMPETEGMWVWDEAAQEWVDATPVE